MAIRKDTDLIIRAGADGDFLLHLNHVEGCIKAYQAEMIDEICAQRDDCDIEEMDRKWRIVAKHDQQVQSDTIAQFEQKFQGLSELPLETLLRLRAEVPAELAQLLKKIEASKQKLLAEAERLINYKKSEYYGSPNVDYRNEGMSLSGTFLGAVGIFVVCVVLGFSQGIFAGVLSIVVGGALALFGGLMIGQSVGHAKLDKKVLDHQRAKAVYEAGEEEKAKQNGELGKKLRQEALQL